MEASRSRSARSFQLTLENDSQAILRALGPFAVAGLTPRKLCVETLGDQMLLRAEFDGLTRQKADWLCERITAYPSVRAAEHRAL